MNDGYQYVLVVGDPEKPCLHGDFGRQIKGVACRGSNGVDKFCLRPPGGIDHSPAEVGKLRGDNLLLWHAVHRREPRAQALLMVHHVGQGRAQGVDVQLPPQPQSYRQVIDR